MPNAKEIKDRMNSVRDTQKITNAMYLIASTKLQKARRELEATKPYFDSLRSEIKRIFRIHENPPSRYFYNYGEDVSHEGRYGILVITADKGLAGAYNMNVIKETLSLLDMHKEHRLFVVGEYGRNYFMQKNIPVEKYFLYSAQNPSVDRAREICSILLEEYLAGRLDKIYVVYTDMKKGQEASAVSTRLLPFHAAEFYEENASGNISGVDYEFTPSVEEVLDGVMPSYITGFVYSALVDSFCSEQSARMNAMDAANRNAQELLNNLNIQYNRVRQGAITQEITEVSAGAKAQKKKREKKLKEMLKNAERTVL